MPDNDTTFITTLSNGARVLVLPMPQLQTAAVSLFVRSGSMHESRPLNGISHFVEHMVFKGTLARDAHRINLDAEVLGAEVNAHTDKDHTAFHMHGLPAHAGRFVAMLADLVQHATFPADELERERQVLLQEYVEDEDDPMSVAWRLFDHACWGPHPVAQPAIGRRANIERLGRGQLVDWVQRQYTGANVVLAAAGPLDPRVVLDAAAAALSGLPGGQPNIVTVPTWVGGMRSRRLAGSPQAHLVLGFPIPGAGAEDPTAELAAALFGEGMSAPLMAELRERRGLVYYAACEADLLHPCGTWVIDASFAPAKLDEVVQALTALLRSQAAHIDPVHLERARNQLAVRRLRDVDRASRRLESAALDLLDFGRVRSAAERLQRLQAVTTQQLRECFDRLLAAPPAMALSGQLGRGAPERARVLLAQGLGGAA